MRRARARAWVVAGLAAVLTAGLVRAQTSPQDEDPIADALAEQEQRRAEEEPPPAPGETPRIVQQTAATSPLPLPAPPAVKSAPAGPAQPPAPETEAAVDPELPQKRLRHRAAVIQAVDKITAESLRFEARVGRPVRYKGLVFTVRACETTAPDEPMKDAIAYLEVRAEPKTQTEATPSRRIYRGWMYASSPSLHPLEHGVYDAWLIACRDSAPRAAGASR